MRLYEKIIVLMMERYNNYLEVNSEKMSSDGVIICFPKDEWDDVMEECAVGAGMEVTEGVCEYCGCKVLRADFNTDARLICLNCYRKKGY